MPTPYSLLNTSTQHNSRHLTELIHSMSNKAKTFPLVGFGIMMERNHSLRALLICCELQFCASHKGSIRNNLYQFIARAAILM